VSIALKTPYGYTPTYHKTNNNMIEIYDNDGATFDRYTIIIDDDVYGMSEDPLSPQGFNQYCGKLADFPFARESTKVGLQELPFEVIEAIKNRM